MHRVGGVASVSDGPAKGAARHLRFDIDMSAKQTEGSADSSIVFVQIRSTPKSFLIPQFRPVPDRPNPA
ncbi:MAG: hypothetical protein ACRC6I_10180 [Paracoccaceae bacterium]